MYHTLQRLGLFTAGQIVPGLELHGRPALYPVLNERAVRASAGIMFVLGFFAFFHAFYLNDYRFIKLFVIIFFIDFFIKVVLNPKFSPISTLARLVTRHQKPEYVGAVQKRFAWAIGLFLASTMLVLLFGLGIQGLPNLIVCGICLTIMFLETSFGFCVACALYNKCIAWGWVEDPEYKPVCAGDSCG